jgi:hypothetical protein
MIRVDRMFLLFGAVSLALMAFGIAVMIGIRIAPERAPMSVYYLSMVCRCPWHNLPKAVQYVEPGQAWSIHAVPGPFRYRVLVPWLAAQLPLTAETSLSGITYASLAISYWLVLLSCRRLGWSAGASIGGLALAYVFEPNLDAYFSPFRVDGFGLMITAAMMYALTVESFWMFAIAGICGVFVRETTLLLLPVWCARDMKRGVVLTVVASIAWLVARGLLFGPPDIISPMTVLTMRLGSPGSFGKDILSTWGWAYAVTAMGVCLFGAHAFRAIGPMSLGLALVALCSYLLASDTMRLFLVLLPMIAIAAAQLVAILMERRQRILLTSLLGLVALQFFVSRETRLSHDPLAIAVVVRPLRLGMVWAIAAAFTLRHELAQSLREKLSISVVRSAKALYR